jgi:hypothetical protein
MARICLRCKGESGHDCFASLGVVWRCIVPSAHRPRHFGQAAQGPEFIAVTRPARPRPFAASPGSDAPCGWHVLGPDLRRRLPRHLSRPVLARVGPLAGRDHPHRAKAEPPTDGPVARRRDRPQSFLAAARLWLGCATEPRRERCQRRAIGPSDHWRGPSGRPIRPALWRPEHRPRSARSRASSADGAPSRPPRRRGRDRWRGRRCAPSPTGLGPVAPRWATVGELPDQQIEGHSGFRRQVSRLGLGNEPAHSVNALRNDQAERPPDACGARWQAGSVGAAESPVSDAASTPLGAPRS